MLQNLSAVELAPLKPGISHPIPQPHNPPESTIHALNNDTEPPIPTPSSFPIPNPTPHLSKSRSIIVIIILTLVLFLNSVSTGFLTVSLPRMSLPTELSLPPNLLLWPQSVFGLTTATFLLPAGSIADVIGSRVVNLTGTAFLGVFIILALQGVGLSLCLPTGMGILSTAIPNGRRRNTAFSALGASQVVGFAAGLLLSGVFVDTIGWRVGWYGAGALTLGLSGVGVWALPKERVSEKPVWGRLKTDIDWVGAGLACGSLGLLSYVLAMTTSDVREIRRPAHVAMLTISLALVPAFAFWVGRQERLGKPALIPNSIWKNKAFTSICLMVLLAFGVMQTMELFVSLFFQQVQRLSALETSIRLLPAIVMGLVLEVTTGLFVHRISVLYLVVISSLLSAGSPLLMAVINKNWPYWYDAFFAQFLMYFSVDVLFTVGSFVISDVFPPQTQALAGAIFNVMNQFGTSLGLAVMGVIASAVTKQSDIADKASPEALEAGYRATFWAAMAWMLVTCCIGVFGLRKIGKVGVKRD